MNMKSTPNPKCNWYFEKENPWLEGFRLLRPILLGSGLNEDLKWGHPCYSIDGSNVLLMHGFKNYFALLFMKGVLMADSSTLLIQQTPHVQSARQIRFTKTDQITEMADTIKEYIAEAIAVEKSGAKVEFKQTTQFAMPGELHEKLDQDSALKNAFEALTPGRQRGYILYFASAKQAKTRIDRIDKYSGKILDGLGLDD
jgi:uncharacterized protein YdeI (YjbR/CyaY-like superfamily)